MRKITQQAMAAFMGGKNFSQSNTRVEVEEESVYLILHGHKIAQWVTNTGDLYVTLAGWPTPTTRERLNGIPGVIVTQRNYDQYLNGVMWDGTWTNLNNWPNEN